MAQELSLCGLSVEADAPLLHEVSLSLRRGRVLALVGSSGSGKSMTCAAALGVLPPGVRQRAGEVRVDGHLVASAQLRGRVVASIMQNPRSAFNPVRNMRAHALETCRALGRPDHEGALLEALAEVGFEAPAHVLGLYPFEMSGGMLQRMMIAIALLSDAPFLFADEPTTDLDAVAQARVLDLLDKVMSTRASGLLLVTHDMGVVARLADEVAVMEAGRIVELADVDTLFARPTHPVTRSLLAAHFGLYGLELPT